MHVKFLGRGDAFGSGGRLNTCFLANHGDASFLIDCGASAMISIRRFGINPNSVGAIVLSHLHADHFGGLPFFSRCATSQPPHPAPVDCRSEGLRREAEAPESSPRLATLAGHAVKPQQLLLDHLHQLAPVIGQPGAVEHRHFAQARRRRAGSPVETINA